MSDRKFLPVDPATAQVLAECGGVLVSVVQRKFGISPLLHNMGNMGTTGGSGTAQASGVKRCSVRLPRGPEVSVWKDDLTTHRVDAVVNAANEYLSHGGGLAAALSLAGGPVVQRLSNEFIKKFGRIPTGQAVCLPPGNLPCKAIIHAVGPQLSYRASSREVDKESHSLKHAVENILRLAEQESFQSVAIPALSSGLFNFPLDLCAEIIVKTLKDYHYSYNSKLSEIRLVNHDEPTVSAMETAFKNILDPKASYSGAVQDHRSSLAPSPLLQMGNVTMHVKNGHIEQEKVDVIVNTISPDLNLTKGKVSSAILEKAGINIQKEITRASQYPVRFGHVIETSGHLLYSQKVYHTVCAEKRDNGFKILQSVVKTCLDKAATGKYSSISFPAIGTGNLDFKEEEVAKLMLEEVADFAKQYKGKKMDVYFVLFPRDVRIIKAFEQEMFNRQSMQSREFSAARNESYSGSSGSNELDRADVGEQPCIEIQCQSSFKTDQREVAKWIHEKIICSIDTCTIFNNHILHLGQREHEKLLSFRSYDLFIQEFLRDGRAGVTIKGAQSKVKEAMLRVEDLCCEAQEEFAQAEESAMMHTVVRWKCADLPGFEEPEITGILERARLQRRDTVTIKVNGCDLLVSLKKMEAKGPNGKVARIERMCMYKDNPLDQKWGQNGSFYQRILVNPKDPGYRDRVDFPYEVVKMEKVENPLLEHHFQQKQKQVSGSPKRMFQQVPAQFRDLVCRVGFQRPYSPPKEQKYGAGIYFGGTASTANRLAEHLEKEEYIYIFEAQVLTGKDTYGLANLIIPPAIGSDPLSRYDSVRGAVDTYVIFNSHQALPVYLLTCKNPSRKTLPI